MKNIVIIAVAAILLSSCRSVQRYQSDEEEEATWHCICRGSWEIVANPQDSFWAENEIVLLIRNEMTVPLLFDVMPWWGPRPEGYGNGPTSIYGPDPPPNFIAPGRTVGIHLLEPFFFKDGALLTLWKRGAEKDSSDKYGMQYFDLLEFRRISAKQMPTKGNLIINVRDEANKAQEGIGDIAEPSE